MITNDKTQAFEGLAKTYDQVRPTYPNELYTAIIQYWQGATALTQSTPTIADVGCGTGISTRAFHQAVTGQCHMIGVEPGKDMLATARESSPEEIIYQEGLAEAIPLDDASVDIVTAAQAAQWFNRPDFYGTINRILKPNGVVAIYENNRDWQHSELLDQHEKFLEQYSVNTETQQHYSRHYRDIPYTQELATHFRDVQERDFSWTRKMPPNDFLAMTLTSTQTQRAVKHIGEARVKELILANAHAHIGADGLVEVPYNTKLYIARK